ncbi:MAG: hypothetical protein AAF492_21720, partial [Verrucomicrobiota bacterium]
MHISSLCHKRIGILGFGREGRSVFSTLERAGHTAPVDIFSDHEVSLPDNASLHRNAEAIESLDVLIRSPGFPPPPPHPQAGHPPRRPPTTPPQKRLEP